jgi:hypothetical protein
MMQLYLKTMTPQGNMLTAQLDAEGFTFKFGELFKRVMSNSGIQDWDKILLEKTEDEKADTQVQQDAQTFMQALQQVQGGGMQSVPPTEGQPMNTTNPMEQGQIGV